MATSDWLTPLAMDLVNHWTQTNCLTSTLYPLLQLYCINLVYIIYIEFTDYFDFLFKIICCFRNYLFIKTEKIAKHRTYILIKCCCSTITNRLQFNVQQRLSAWQKIKYFQAPFSWSHLCSGTLYTTWLTRLLDFSFCNGMGMFQDDMTHNVNELFREHERDQLSQISELENIENV